MRHRGHPGLTRQQIRLLDRLVHGKGNFVPREVLLVAMNVRDVEVDPKLIDVQVCRIRKHLPAGAIVTLYGDTGEEALKRAAQQVGDDLRTLPGMGAIVMTGARPYQIRVDVDRVKLLQQGLRLPQVADIVQAWMAEVPSGTMRTGGENVGVRTLGAAERADAIRAIPLKATPAGQVVTVGDVAKVSEGFADEQVLRRYNGKPATSLVIFKSADEDAVRIAEMVRGYVAAEHIRSPIEARACFTRGKANGPWRMISLTVGGG
jgi:multidrug efflux pump subunit AcrB